MKTVSAREANQSFSKLLAAVEAGEEVVVTKRGNPVARLVRFRSPADEKKRQAAIRRMRRLLKKGLHLGGVTFTRDGIYER